MTGEKFFFTSFEDFNGGNVTFSDGCIARVRGRYSGFISRYPDLDGVLFINGLKANLISIRQICDSEFSVKLSQNKCEVLNKKGEITFTRHRIVDNYYAINQGSNTSLVCSKAKIGVTELWHRRLGHINYGDLVHLTNKDLVRGIPKLSDQPNTLHGECMKGKQVRVSHKEI